MMLKRGGRGQDPAGAAGTSEGELAVECPACPHPDRNLPDGWELAGPLMYVLSLVFQFTILLMQCALQVFIYSLSGNRWKFQA
jgi:hypothetical protein